MTKVLSAYLEDFYHYSGKASDSTRTAALAGIGLVWVFRVDAKPVALLPHALLVPAACFAISIAADVLQYVAGTIIWGVFHRIHERRAKEGADPPTAHRVELASPIYFFFVLKVAAVIVGYASVFNYLRGVWLH